MAARGTSLQVMIDHPAQVSALDAASTDGATWSAFVKVDSGNQWVSLNEL